MLCTCIIHNKIHLKSLFAHLMILILSFGRLEALSFLMIYKALDHRRAKKRKYWIFWWLMNDNQQQVIKLAVKLWSIHINNSIFSIFHHSTRWWWILCLRRRWWCCYRMLIQPGQRWTQVLERKVAKLSKHFFCLVKFPCPLAPLSKFVSVG